MTDRPTDTDTARVVAKWKGADKAECFDCDGTLHFVRWWIDGVVRNTIDDPRDDTDAALELLHWVIREQGLSGVGVYAGWHVEISGGDFHHACYLPISGEPFRHAVVALAIKVLGE